MNEPKVNVGIQFVPEVVFTFHGNYRFSSTGNILTGEYTACYHAGKILFQEALYDELCFEPVDADAGYFELHDVVIGINFHWERKENQRFNGNLKIVAPLNLPEGGKPENLQLVTEDKNLTAINEIGVEAYLTSVISSEMSATSSLELLKAHAVISRSWLLAQIEKSKQLDRQPSPYQSTFRTDDTLIRWYDREDHTRFDVCADDHCQRYQGITRQNKTVEEAVAATRGELLEYDGTICDARFSKSCGGVGETFENCWEPVPHAYLTAFRDMPDNGVYDDLSIEENAEKWIRTSPPAFCNTHDREILSQVLNNYDQETTDFYRWKVEYSQEELSALIAERSGIDFGTILDLVPIERGTSGRLTKLKIAGSRRTMTIGKELEIRKTLSTSHLYSSAFVVDKELNDKGIPQKFMLTGAGWGHGVGLCQIGAAVMGANGYSYKDILLHYFKGADVVKRY